MNIIVCVKQVPDPEIPPSKFKIDPVTKKVIPPPGVPPVISVFDERAVEAACRIKDKHGGKITIISLGSGKVADVVKHSISMGADDGFVIQDETFENLDSFGTAYVLSKAIKKIGSFDLILCGRQAADWGEGQVGSILAEFLGIPLVTLAFDIIVEDNKFKVKRVIKDGYEITETPIPSLITVSSEIGLPRLPAGVRLMLASRKQLPIWKAKDIGVDQSELQKISGHTEITEIFIPIRKAECEMITGNTPSEAGANLAQKIINLL